MRVRHAAFALLLPATLAAQTELTADLLKPISLRSIGPGLVTGRVADVKIDPNNTNVWYVAAAFGGVWKTVNRGVSFTPIFDDGGAFKDRKSTRLNSSHIPLSRMP